MGGSRQYPGEAGIKASATLENEEDNPRTDLKVGHYNP